MTVFFFGITGTNLPGSKPLIYEQQLVNRMILPRQGGLRINQ